MEGSARELKNNRAQQKQVKEQQSRQAEQKSAVDARLRQAGLRSETIRVMLKNLAEDDERLSRFFAEYDKKKVKADKLMEIYHASDYRELKAIIYERCRKVILDLAKRREAMAYNRTYMEQLDSFNPVVAPRELLEIVDYIRRCHGATCVLGSDYLCGLEPEGRRALLERMPHPPYSVIVQSDFSKIRADHILAEKEFGDFAYPIIGLDTILSDALEAEDGHIFYMTKDKALFYDKAAIVRKKDVLTREMADIQKEMDRLQDNEATYMTDVEYLGEFIVDYYDKFVDNMAVISENRAQMERLNEESRVLQNQCREDEALIAGLDESLAALNVRLSELSEEEGILKTIIGQEEQLEAVRGRLRAASEQKRSLEVRLTQARIVQENDERARDEVRRRMAFVEQAKAEQEKTWKDIYSVYYREDAETETAGDGGEAVAGGEPGAAADAVADGGDGEAADNAVGAAAEAAAAQGEIASDDENGAVAAATAANDEAAPDSEGETASDDEGENAPDGESETAPDGEGGTVPEGKVVADGEGDAAPSAESDSATEKRAPETSDEIDAAFRGIREAFEKEYTDLEDKKQLLETYTQSMERLTLLIAERAVPVSELEEMYAKGQLTAYAPEVIAGLKEELAQLTGKIRELTKTVEEVRANKDRLYGSVENAISSVKEKYGSFEEVDLKDRSYDTFVNEQQAILAQMKEKYASALSDLERIGHELKSLEDTRKDLERLMRVVRVNYNLTRDFYAGGVNLRQRFEELSEQYELLRRDEVRKKEEFEKNRDKLADILRELKAEPLADEVRYHIELPKDEQEARRLVDNVRETIQVIALEKERISQGIRDMVQIKESFENQCLQRCLDIKTELERLPGLSKITLDGKQVPMIQLRIPYIREEFYKPQMASYIDAIVSNADTYKDFDDKLKYIRQKLSWKSLFSVIVTDMNAIRLNLYKRERIHEQSRYLKYEEAVGSTGQYQGIYIQFLIAVINYISAIYSGNNDTAGLKKVIFIDNPFGAAKDIYIWEPIFELLRTNSVQLIVPARGATPAISGKFDVNYVLGQKLIDGKQQTVVIDYHSNIHIEDVEYVKIDFEQEVFDFI